ncbi:MAG: GNAT family N-acetyltransferase [Anaerolineae bacterium]
MSVSIRPARESEAGTIKGMIFKEGLDPTTLQWENFLVAEQNGQIIGLGQVKRYGGLQEIGSLVVKKEHRGQGIAAQLIAALEATADRPLYLSCVEKMRPYYERFGYREIPIEETPRAFRRKLSLAHTFLRIKVVAMVKES